MKNLFFVLTMLLASMSYPNTVQAATGVSIFERFPWLTTSNLIDPSTCTDENCPVERIDVYQAGSYQYLLITGTNGEANLYNQDGQLYCQNSGNFDCVAAYGFDAPVDTWRSNSGSSSTCSVDEQWIQSLEAGGGVSTCTAINRVTQIDLNGARYFRTWVGPNFETTSQACAVQEYFGNVKDCAGREICRFALTAPPADYDAEVCNALQAGQGIQKVLWERSANTCAADDPFSLPVIQEAINSGPSQNSDGEICPFAEEIIQLEYNGSTYFRINEGSDPLSSCTAEPADRFYDCEGKFVGGIGAAPSCQSAQLCNGLDNATASGTVIWRSPKPDGGPVAKVFLDYPWLTDLVNPNSCTGETVEVYKSGIHPYLLVANADGDEKLYNQGGQLYCQQSANYSCVDAYGFDDSVDRWACTSSAR